MKQLFFVAIILFAFTIASSAQDGERMYRKFKGDLSFGYAGFAKESDLKNGFIIALEPKFQVLDQLAIGIRIETILLAKNVNAAYSVDDGDVTLKVYQSVLATGEFYFTKNYNVRPFAGAGAGLYLVSTTNSGYETTNSHAVKFGEMIRAGVEIKHFRLALEYNIVPNTNSNYYDSNTGESFIRPSRNSYFGIKAGVCFGGGPMNRN